MRGRRSGLWNHNKIRISEIIDLMTLQSALWDLRYDGKGLDNYIRERRKNHEVCEWFSKIENIYIWEIENFCLVDRMNSTIVVDEDGCWLMYVSFNGGGILGP